MYRRRRCLECGHTFWTTEEQAFDDDVRNMLAYMKSMERRKKDADKDYSV